MSTPIGWHRASLLHRNIGSVPHPGSLREAVCILVQRTLDERAYYATLVSAAAAGGKAQIKVLKDALEKYRELIFPYMAGTRAQMNEGMKNALDRIVARGPLRVNKRKTED